MNREKRYAGEPNSVKTLEVRLRNIVKADPDLSEDVFSRLRREIASIILGQVLARVVDGEGKPIFLIKGGVAMSLRLGLRARATKDFDVACRIDKAEALERLRDELVDGWGPFRLAFAQEQPKEIRDTGAWRIDVKEGMNGAPFSTVQLEIAEAEGEAGQQFDLESSRLLELDRLGFEAPERVPLVTIAYLVAQKLHACTDHSTLDRVNDRFRDLIDLQLVEHALDDPETLRSTAAACREIFTLRGKHDWPPSIKVVAGWEEGYRKMAQDMKFEPDDVNEAARRAEAVISRIDAAEDQPGAAGANS